jgi:hypothetical protein
MASADESVNAVPQYQCTECGQVLDMNLSRGIEKRSKAQQRRDEDDSENYDRSDIQLIITSCGNRTCSQYAVVKVIRIPRIKVPSARIDLA